MAAWNGFPLITLPAMPPAPRSVEWQFTDVMGVNENPFSLQQQFYRWGQAIIEISFMYPPVPTNPALSATRGSPPAWQAFLAALQGNYGVFLSPADPLHESPQNASATSPTVSGVNASGVTTINVSGGTSTNQTVGDWIGVPGNGASFSTGSRIYLVTAVGSGTLGIYPPLREATVGGEVIVINGAQGVWRLKSPTRKFSVDTQRTFGFSLEAREAL